MVSTLTPTQLAAIRGSLLVDPEKYDDAVVALYNGDVYQASFYMQGSLLQSSTPVTESRALIAIYSAPVYSQTLRRTW